MKRESTEKLEQIFRAFDEKRIGKVPTKDLAKLIYSAKLLPNEKEVEELKMRIDPYQTGCFDMKSFIEIGLEFTQKQAQMGDKEELIKAFSVFAKDKSQYLSFADLKKVIIKSFGETLSEEQINYLLEEARVINGKVNIREFAEIMTKTR